MVCQQTSPHHQYPGCLSQGQHSIDIGWLDYSPNGGKEEHGQWGRGREAELLLIQRGDKGD